MKKNTFFFLAFLYPLVALSQGVKTNHFDRFLKKQWIGMEPVVITGLPENSKMAIDLTAAGNDLSLNFAGTGWGASTVDRNDELVLLFSNDSTVTVKASALQSFEPGIGENLYRHQYSLHLRHLLPMSEYNLKGLRKYSFGTYSELTIPGENSEKIKALSKTFLAELKKANITSTVKRIDVKDIHHHIGDSVVFCSKVYRTRYFRESEEAPTLLDVQANFTDPFVNVVILQKDRPKFNNEPEKAYLEKELCISGVVRLRNNLPYLLVQNREQLKLNSTISLEEVGLFAGDSISVSGKVEEARIVENGGQRQMHLSLGGSYPSQLLTVILENGSGRNFDMSGSCYIDQVVKVSGQVSILDEKPRMFINRKDEIKIFGRQNALATAAVEGQAAAAVTAEPDAAQGQKADGFSEQGNESLAEFPGGGDAFLAYLEKALVVPLRARGITNKQVVVSFGIDAQGICNDVTPFSAEGLEEEIKKVMLTMPKWKPAFRNGRFIATRITQPVNF